MVAAIQKTNKNILLVDPNPEVLAKAAQNMIYNGFGLKSKFVSAFIGDKDGEKLNFYTIGSGAAGSMYSSHATTAAAVNVPQLQEAEPNASDTVSTSDSQADPSLESLRWKGKFVETACISLQMTLRLFQAMQQNPPSPPSSLESVLIQRPFSHSTAQINAFVSQIDILSSRRG